MQRPIDKISAFESQDVQWEKELNLICEVITQSIQDESAMGRAVPGELEALLLSSRHSRWTTMRGTRGGEGRGAMPLSGQEGPCRSNDWCRGPEKHQHLGWRARAGKGEEGSV